MSGDFIHDFLAKLSAKTGREWTLLDLVRLAEKLPDLNEANVDSFLAQLSEMGLALPQEKKEVLKGKVLRKEGVTPEDLEQLKKRFAEKQARSANQRGSAAMRRMRKARLRLNRKKNKGKRQAEGTVLRTARSSVRKGKRRSISSRRLAVQWGPPKVRRLPQESTNQRTFRRSIAEQQSDLLPAEQQYMAKVARQLRQLRKNSGSIIGACGR